MNRADPVNAEQAAARANFFVRIASDATAKPADAVRIKCQIVHLIATHGLVIATRDTLAQATAAERADLITILEMADTEPPSTPLTAAVAGATRVHDVSNTGTPTSSRQIEPSRFAAGCAECLGRIAVGEPCVWDEDEGCWHPWCAP